MFTDNNRLSIRQLQAMFLISTLGMGLNILPYFVNSLMSFGLLFGFIIIILFFVIHSKNLYSDSLQACLTRKYGTLTSKVITGLFAAKLIMNAAIELNFFTRIDNMLPVSLSEDVFIVIVMCVCFYGVSKSCEKLGRLAEVILIIVFVPLVVIAIHLISNANLKLITVNTNTATLRAFYATIVFSAIDFIFHTPVNSRIRYSKFLTPLLLIAVLFVFLLRPFDFTNSQSLLIISIMSFMLAIILNIFFATFITSKSIFTNLLYIIFAVILSTRNILNYVCWFNIFFYVCIPLMLLRKDKT